MPEVLLEVDAGVAVLTLDDPERNNAWSPEIETIFYDRLAAIEADPAVRVAILTGKGRMFCPGASTDRLNHIAEVGLDYSDRIPFTKTLEFSKPLIAAINGGCAGIGFIQAMFCDMRFVSSTAKLTTAFVRRGLPAEHAISWLLPRIVGVERAMDLLLSGRTVTAQEALRIGLVSRVAPPEELMTTALDYAKDIAANCAPKAMAMIKRQVIDDLGSTYADALERAYALTVEASRGEEFRNAVEAFTRAAATRRASDRRSPS
ncbi:MAG TPA: enoyl-CoA hydratase-related protein [Mycobacteriales bacterium]|nr:enoyl-CoA hydratase-related protein [Mycobacteriales bacterium]